MGKKIGIPLVTFDNGDKVNLTIKPSKPNTGIIFKRVDLKRNNIIIPNFENVTEATLCTTISNQYGVKVWKRVASFQRSCPNKNCYKVGIMNILWCFFWPGVHSMGFPDLAGRGADLSLPPACG